MTAAPDAELAAAVTSVIEALNGSTRPLVFAGNGIRLSRGEREFAEVIRLLKVPVVATWCAADLISSDDPLFVGRPGSVASRGANFALQNCDFLLSIGARLDFAITGFAPDRLSREAHKVMVDIDAAELAKLSPHIQTPVLADARAFLAGILAQHEDVQQARIGPGGTTAAPSGRRAIRW